MDNESFLNRYLNDKDEEDFLEFESKVTQVLRLLGDVGAAQKNDDDELPEEAVADPLDSLASNVTEDNFIVTIKADRSIINPKPSSGDLSRENSRAAMDGGPVSLDKFTFMQQLEEDAEKRYRIRKEQENIAQKFRERGNTAFREDQFETAIVMYTKAIEHIKDSPILYTNRALCYYRLRNYKRALMDCDYVIMKLDEKHVRAWMYRAACYRRLGDDEGYEASIASCKKHNPKKYTEIDDFVSRIHEM